MFAAWSSVAADPETQAESEPPIFAAWGVVAASGGLLETDIQESEDQVHLDAESENQVHLDAQCDQDDGQNALQSEGLLALDSLPAAKRKRGRPKKQAAQIIAAADSATADAAHQVTHMYNASLVLKSAPISSATDQGLLAAASLPVKTLFANKARFASGLALPSPLTKQLAAAYLCSGLDDDKAWDTETYEQCKQLLSGDIIRNSSKVSQCEQWGLDYKQYDKLLRTTAAGCLVEERAVQVSLEQHLSVGLPIQDLLTWDESARYDETPMPVAHRTSSVDIEPKLSSPGNQIVPSGIGQTAVVSYERQVQCTDKPAPMKIMQTLMAYGITVRLPNKKFAAFHGKKMCHLQTMERNTGLCIKNSQMNVSPASPFTQRFQMRSRLATKDRAQANTLAETMINKERGPGWATCEMDCELHIAATTCKRSLGAFLNDNITGMIHCALSLQDGYAMTIFRQEMYKEIFATIDPQEGEPPRSAFLYRMRCLNLFTLHGQSVLLKRLLLMALPQWQLGA